MVYVDNMRSGATVFNQTTGQNVTGRWSHLTADSDEELHRFAEQLGLRREYHQPHPKHSRSHYDVTEGKRRYGSAQSRYASVTNRGAVSVNAAPATATARTAKPTPKTRKLSCPRPTSFPTHPTASESSKHWKPVVSSRTANPSPFEVATVEPITREELAEALVTMYRLVNSMPDKSFPTPIDGTEYVRSCNGYRDLVAPVLQKLGHNPYTPDKEPPTTELKTFVAMLTRAGIGHGTRDDRSANPDYHTPGTAVQVECNDTNGTGFTVAEFAFDLEGKLDSVHTYPGEVG